MDGDTSGEVLATCVGVVGGVTRFRVAGGGDATAAIRTAGCDGDGGAIVGAESGDDGCEFGGELELT